MFPSVINVRKRHIARGSLVRNLSHRQTGKMADESEDQWLYGDSTDGKEYTPANIQSEVQQNDSVLAEAQENSQTPEDQKLEDAGETLSEVCARRNLSRSFTIDSPAKYHEKNSHLSRFRRQLVSCITYGPLIKCACFL